MNFQAHGDPSDRLAISLAMIPLLTVLASCSSLGSTGPSSRAIRAASGTSVDQAGIKVVELTDRVARRVSSSTRSISLAALFGDVPPIGSVVEPGDVLVVSVWESPPAALFGSTATFGTTTTGAVLASSAATPQQTSLPEMLVESDGYIRVPFAGSIRAAGRTPQQIERDIIRGLAGKAHAPQVTVRTVLNANDAVTVVGDVRTPGRVSLSPRGERLLDALTSAGGVSHPVGKMTVQITRGDHVGRVPFEQVVQNPSENIRLQTKDVVTASYQPFSFTALGSTGLSSEVEFEATGLKLSQALGRVGGLREDRANARGAFIFRFEDPAALDPSIFASSQRTPQGMIPVIYQVDLSNPATLFVAQNFPMRDKDVLYVSNAPMTDLQKFVGIVSSMAFTVIGLGQAVP